MELSALENNLLMEALCRVPVDEFSSVLADATKMRIEDCPNSFEAEFQKEQPTYHLDAVTRQFWVQKLGGLFAGFTVDDIQRTTKEWSDEVLRSEFGHKGLSRQAAKDNPYWYEYHMLLEGWKHVSEKPINVALNILDEHNHGHSGFVRQSRRVYFAPRNDVEAQLSQEYRELHIKTVERLLDTTEPAIGIFEHMDVQLVFRMLTRLGAEIVGYEQLIVRGRKLAVESAALPTDHDFAKNSANDLVGLYEEYWPEKPVETVKV